MMERDPSSRVGNAPLLPKRFSIMDYYHAPSREHRLIVAEQQNYRIEHGLRSSLEQQGSILKMAGVQHPAGSIEFVIPDGVTSLAAFLNSTSTDQHRAWKRKYMFNRIQRFLDSFTERNVSIRAEPAANRYSIGQSELSDPILLPAVPLRITEATHSKARQANTEFYVQIQRDIIEAAPPDDRDFPF